MTAFLDRSSQSPCLVMQPQGAEPITQKVSQSFFCIGRNLQLPNEGFDDLNLQFEYICSALPSGLLQSRRSFGRHLRIPSWRNLGAQTFITTSMRRCRLFFRDAPLVPKEGALLLPVLSQQPNKRCKASISRCPAFIDKLIRLICRK